MVSFKALPKYQFERRIDIFLVPFLPEILSNCLKSEGPFEFVVPEFPLKRPESNKSRNADYLFFDRSPEKERWILFELKTDDGSIGASQMSGYRRAMKAGMARLVKDVRTIRDASPHAGKYSELIRRLEGYPVDRPVHLVYLSPGSLRRELHGTDEYSITFGDLLGLELKTSPDVWNWIRATVVQACAV